MDFSKIIELEMRLLNPSVRKDAEELGQLLADDFLEFGTSGKIYNKQNVMERLPSEVSSTIEAADFQGIELATDVVQLRFRTLRTNDDGSVSASLRSSIWKRFGEKWRLIFHQGTSTHS